MTHWWCVYLGQFPMTWHTFSISEIIFYRMSSEIEIQGLSLDYSFFSMKFDRVHGYIFSYTIFKCDAATEQRRAIFRWIDGTVRLVLARSPVALLNMKYFWIGTRTDGINIICKLLSNYIRRTCDEDGVGTTAAYCVCVCLRARALECVGHGCRGYKRGFYICEECGVRRTVCGWNMPTPCHATSIDIAELCVERQSTVLYYVFLFLSSFLSRCVSLSYSSSQHSVVWSSIFRAKGPCA